MKILIIGVAAALLIISASFTHTKTQKKMNTIVLVHGAWADASSWDGVVPFLKAAGHEVIAVNLPGHGKDNTAYNGIQLKTYVDAVKSAIGSRQGVTLVGHSMAGIVISQVAEQIPAQLKELVYLAAYVPANGESLFSLAQQDGESLIGKNLALDEKTFSAKITKEAIPEIFAGDAPKPVQDYLMEHTKDEPLVPLNSTVSLTDAGFGKVDKSYIYAIYDKAIGYQLQQKMVKNAKTINKVYLLPTSHTPFIPMPSVVASLILQESK